MEPTRPAGRSAIRHAALKLSLRRTPVHATTGCGTFQRRLPTGGAANGTARKMRSARDESAAAAMVPPVTTTVSRVAT